MLLGKEFNGFSGTNSADKEETRNFGWKKLRWLLKKANIGQNRT